MSEYIRSTPRADGQTPIQVSDRTDWSRMETELNNLHRRLQHKPPAFKAMWDDRNPGCILNAYREGDASFAEAIQAIEDLAKGDP